MSFDVVWLVGMIEGGAPPALPPDPLLPETSLARGGRASAQGAAHCAGAVRLSVGGGLRAAPLPVLPNRRRGVAAAGPPVEVAAGAGDGAGGKPGAHQWAGPAGRPPLALGGRIRRASDRRGLGLVPGGRPRLPPEPAGAVARRQGSGSRDHPLVRSGMLARADRLGRSRFAYGLTEFDGNLTSVAAGAIVCGAPWKERWSLPPAWRPGRDARSATSWAHVLRLSALETPEETAVISALERGSLVHTILERFISEAEKSGAAPRVWARQWSEEGLPEADGDCRGGVCRCRETGRDRQAAAVGSGQAGHSRRPGDVSGSGGPSCEGSSGRRG